MERLGVLERQFHALAQLFLRLVQPADVGPAGGRGLHHDLAHGRRLHTLERFEEIVAPDAQRIEHVLRDRLLLEVELGHDPAHRLDRRLARQRGKVRADKAVGGARQFLQVDTLGQRHPAGMDAQDLAPPALVGHAHHDLAVEATGTAQRLVDRVGPVGCSDDHQVRARVQPVHQRQQLRDKALFRLAMDFAALGRDRIDLVDEDDRGRRLGRFLEHFAQVLLALAISRAHDFRAVDGEEAGLTLARHRARKARLAGSRRAVQQHALGRIDAQAGEQFGIAQGQFHHLAQLADGVAHAAHVVIIDVGAAAARLLVFGSQLDFGVLVDVHDALGHRRDDRQADLRQREGRGIEHLAQLRRHVAPVDLLLSSGGDKVARHQRTPCKVALQSRGWPLQTQVALRGREDHALRRAGFDLSNFYMFTRADICVCALQAVEPDQFQPLVLGIGQHGTRGGAALADDLDHVAFGHAKPAHHRAADARDAVPAFFLSRSCDLKPDRLAFRECRGVCHGPLLSVQNVLNRSPS